MEAEHESFSVVYYCTGHGLGHLSRTIEVIRHLTKGGHTVTVVTGAPVHIFAHELPPSGLTVRHAILDTGAKQRDAFTVDQRGSLEEYVATAGGHRRSEIVVEESGWLRDSGADLVVSDIVPLACVAASAAGLPCIAVSNFSWDFIYSEYLTAAGSAFRDLVWQIADDYACALRLLRLPGHVPMPAFREVLDVPLVVRHARRTRQEVRNALEIPQDAKLVCFIYGGQPPGADWRLEASCLPAGWICMVCSAGQPPGGAPLPHNFRLAPEDMYTPDLIESCDVVLGKIGYGTTSECLAHRRPLVFLRRDFFNEEPFLRKLLELSDAAVEMKRRDFLAGNWAPYLERAVALNPIYPEPTNGAEVVATELIQTAREFRQLSAQGLGLNGLSSPTAAAGEAASTAPGGLFSGSVGSPPGSGGGGGAGSTPRHPGQSRLRDTIAWGYMMCRHASRQLSEVPEWYTRGQLPWATPRGTDPTAGRGRNITPGGGTSSAPYSSGGGGGGGEVPPYSGARGIINSGGGSGGVAGQGLGLEDVDALFEILEEPSIPLDEFPDTLRFLSLLGSLEDHHAVPSQPSSPSSTVLSSPRSPDSEAKAHIHAHVRALSFGNEALVLPELRAAAGLFHRNDPILVARAPGRLDVMGGIADYSGSTVLQMPIAEAAHVALQLQTPRHQRLWRHMQPRHAAAAATSAEDPSLKPPAAPALRIVSLNADATNRGPAFDMDISELFTAEGEPLSYAAARAYFLSDPALSWAAYVAGGLIVLMREKGVRPKEGIAILVSSEVPEGKGVSSSAAVEVAAMSALAAAHGIELTGREMALLCQKVENLVVGAPCGVMDQMASALGEAGWLLALRCQPAEVDAPCPIPDHLRFWGVDSGIRHSVGGSDYGAVRTGAFMGLKILSTLSSSSLSRSSPPEEGLKIIGEGYLANVAPSSFSRRLERKLPETLTGAEFLEKYGPHLDAATTVDPTKTYAVRVPTAHPVYENFRVLAFRQALAAQVTSPLQQQQQLEVLGELMLQSHGSYSACGLGSEGTGRLVALVLEDRAAAEAEGRAPPLYGAKITGGGTGGTVCIVGTADSAGEAAVKRVTERYEIETGHGPQVFAGTSQGAMQFGIVRVQRRRS